MLNEPVWLPFEAVVEINKDLVSLTQEKHFLRERGYLESALARPRNVWTYGEEDIPTLAAILLEGIAQSHPFEQGNKRTAFMAALEFIYDNGYEWPSPDNGEAALAVLALVNHQSDVQELAEFFRANIRISELD